MRISIIKANITNRKLRSLIAKDVWEIPCCREALGKISGGEDNLDLVFSVTKSSMINDLLSTDKGSDEFKLKSKRYVAVLNKFSKRLYGETTRWRPSDEWKEIEDSFGFSEGYFEIQEEKKRSLVELGFLYERLGLKPLPKYDIVKLLSKDLEATRSVLAEKDAISSKEELFSIVEPILSVRYLSGTFNMKDQILARCLSRLAYENMDYFYSINGFEPIQQNTAAKMQQQ